MTTNDLADENDCGTDTGTDTRDEWPASEPVGHSKYAPLDMARNITDERVKNRITWVDGFGRAYADSLAAAIGGA